MALQKVQRTARRQAVSQTRTRALGINTGAGDERTAIMSGLAKFAQVGSLEANRQQRAEIETRKALGAERAARDLVEVEQNRQGITQDDVLATKLAYNAVVGKHETMQAGNEFVEWFSQNPNADDEMVSSKKKELYQPLFEKYGDDELSLQQISLDVQESQFRLQPVQEKIKGEYTKQKSVEAMTMQVGDFLADPQADIASIVDTEVPAQAKSLGLTEFEYKKMLMQEMTSRAASGDNRLLEHLKDTDWSKNSVLISKAENSYQQFSSRENAIAIGDALGTIEIDNKKLTEPWETTLKKIEQLNKQYPNAVSAAKVAQMKQARATASKVEKSNTDMMSLSYENMFNEDGIPLAMDGQFTPKQKKDFVQGLDGIFAKKTQDLIDGGMKPEEANSAMNKQRLDWSRVNRIKVPLLEENLKGLLSLNPEDYPNSNDLPQYAKDGLSLLQSMDSATLELYFSGREDKAFAINIKDGLKNREPYSAFKRASNIKRNPFKSTAETRADITDAVGVAVTNKLDASWYEVGKKDVPEWQVAQIKSRVNDEAMTNAYNGMLDPDSNAKQSIATIMQDFSPTFNGTLINVPKAKLAQDADINIKNVDTYIEGFVYSNMQYITDEVGSEVPPEDVSLDFSPNGTFILRHKGGEQIGGRFTFAELKSVGAAADNEALREIHETSVEERNARIAEDKAKAEDAQHMALFYKEWGNTYHPQNKE